MLQLLQPRFGLSLTELCFLFRVCRTKVDVTDADNFPKMVELWFMFSMIWSICCSVDEDGRKKIDAYLREIDGSFPNKDSVYEYYVEPKTRSWIHWEEKLKQGWKLNPRFDSCLSLPKADGSRGVGFYPPFVYVSVCLFFHTISQKLM